MDDLTSAALEAHRKVQVLAEDVEAAAALGGVKAYAVVQSELQFIRTDCHVTDVQNSIGDSCIRAVRFYEKKSGASLRDVVGDPPDMPRRRLSSMSARDATPVQRKREFDPESVSSLPRPSNGILLSPSGSPLTVPVGTSKQSTPNVSPIACTTTEVDADDEAADSMLEDINYILHAISAGSNGKQYIETHQGVISHTVQLATFLLKIRDLVLIKEDIGSVMQIIAALQKQYTEVCNAKRLRSESKFAPAEIEHSLLALVLQSPYVLMEYQWVYRHTTNSYIMLMLRAGLVYTVRSKSAGDSDDEAGGWDVAIITGGSALELGGADLPNPTHIYAYGSPLLTDTRQSALRRALESVDAYIMTAMSPHSAVSSGITEDAPLDIYGSTIGAATSEGDAREREVQAARRGSIGALISKMNTSDAGGGRRGSRMNYELYTSTDTMLAFCRAVLTLRSALISRDSDTILVTMKQWLQTVDVTKRNGQAAAEGIAFSTSNWLKPITNSAPTAPPNQSNITCGSKQWEQLPPHYLQELKNIYISHHNDLLVTSLLLSLKDSGVRENSVAFVATNRKEWELQHEAQKERLFSLERLLLQFDHLQEECRMRRRSFSYQLSSGTDATEASAEGLKIDCDSDRSEEVVLGSVLGNNSGNAFIWEPLHELVALSRLIFALRTWSSCVDSTYAATFIDSDNKHSGGSSTSENEDDRLISVGSEIVRGLEDQMPPPVFSGTPENAKHVFGTGANEGPNAPVVPFPLVQRELELARLTVSELMAAQALKKCIMSFHSAEEGARRYCSHSFQLPKQKSIKDKHHAEKHHSEKRMLIADIDSASVDVEKLQEVEEYVCSGLKVVINTSLGSADVAQMRSPISRITPKRYDRLGNVIQAEGTDPVAAAPKASFPRGVSVGTSSNCYVTRLFNTAQLVRRLRSALRAKDTNSSDDWSSVRGALQEEGLLDSAGEVAYFQHARTVLANEEEYQLNCAKYHHISDTDGEGNSFLATKNSIGAERIAAKYILHAPVDTEIRLLIQQVQIRQSLLALTSELAHRDSWCSVSAGEEEDEEDASATLSTLGTSATTEELLAERNNPKMLRRRQAFLSLRRLHAAIAHLEEAKSRFVFQEVPISEGGCLPLEHVGVFVEKKVNESMSVEIAKDTSIISHLDKPSELSSPTAFHLSKTSSNHINLRKVASKVDTGRTKPRAIAKTPMKIALDREREQHLLARRGKTPSKAKVPVTVVGVIGATPAIVDPASEPMAEKPAAKPQGPAQRNLESLLQSARLVARVRELLLEVRDDIKHETIASAAALTKKTVQSRLGVRSSNEHAAQIVQDALGVHVDIKDIASVIASRDIVGILEANGRERASNKVLVHSAAIPELTCYYSLLNGQRRQINAIVSKIFAIHSTIRTLSTSASASVTSFTSKVQHMAKFAGGGARVSDMECVQWMLLRSGSQLAADLPGNIIGRVGSPTQNPAWAGIASAAQELQTILRLAARTYGPFWYNNTAPRVPGAAPDSSRSDLGVIFLVLSAHEIVDEFKRVTAELNAMEAASSNGSHYHRSTYKSTSTGDANTRYDIFDVSAVEQTLRDSLKYALRAHEDSTTVETNNGFSRVDGGRLCASVTHYRRLLRLDAMLLHMEKAHGIVRPKSGEDLTAYHTDAAHVLVQHHSLAEVLVSTASEIGGGMWEHPLVRIARTGLHLLTSSIASATRLAIAASCISGNVAAAAAATLQARQEQYEENSHALRDFCGLNPHASLALRSSPSKMTQAYTNLPTLLASLSVWMSENCFDSLCYPPSRERSSAGSAASVQLLVACGRTCPVMRNELFIMAIVRYDSSEAVAQVVLWRLLLCLLAAFPPSEVFEPYLQAWLHAANRESESQQICALAKQGLQRMHECIFLHGYGQRLSDYATEHVSEAASAIDALWAEHARDTWHQSGGTAEAFYDDEGESEEECEEEEDYEEDAEVYEAIFDQASAIPAATLPRHGEGQSNGAQLVVPHSARKAHVSLLSKIMDSSDDEDDKDEDGDASNKAIAKSSNGKRLAEPK